MGKFRGRRQVSERIYVHNDLSNGAHYFKEIAEAKLAVGNREGIAFDILASLVLLAFAFEAKVNFLGHKLITGWRERQPFNNKVDEVLAAATGVVPDWGQRPYSAVRNLKALRDGIAHGKPMVIEANEVVPEGEGRGVDLDGEWEIYCNEVFLQEAHEDIDAIWNDLLPRAGIEFLDTLSHGESSGMGGDAGDF